jgi:DNA-directed RNA polymerase specialized sigma24 family protein
MKTSTIEQKAIWDEYGETIEKLAKEEHLARAHRGGGAKWYGRFGQDVTDPSAIVATAWVRLIEAGVTLEDIKAKGNPHGWLRRVVQWAGYRVAVQTSDKGRSTPAGWNAATGNDDEYGDPEHLGAGSLDHLANSEAHASTVGNPEEGIDQAALMGALVAEVQRILDKVPEGYRETMRLYTEGLDWKGIAEAQGIRKDAIDKRLQRARKGLLPEEVQSLIDWRSMQSEGRTNGTEKRKAERSTLYEVWKGLARD